MAAEGRAPLLLAPVRSALGSVAKSWISINEELSCRRGPDEEEDDEEEELEEEDVLPASSRESPAHPGSSNFSDSHAATPEELPNGPRQSQARTSTRTRRPSANSSSILSSVSSGTPEGASSSRPAAERDSSARLDEAVRGRTAVTAFPHEGTGYTQGLAGGSPRTETLQAGLLLDWDARACCHVAPPTTDARVPCPDADADADAGGALSPPTSHGKGPLEGHPGQQSEGSSHTSTEYEGRNGGGPLGSIARGGKAPLWPGGLEGHSLVGLRAQELSQLGACDGMMVSTCPCDSQPDKA